MPVVEAMQFGKAVFAANRTSLPEVCNGHAIMWEHLDTESMVQSIREHLPDFYKDKERLKNQGICRFIQLREAYTSLP